VVLMTGNEKEDILTRIRETAVDQALFKPVTLAELDDLVQGLLHKDMRDPYSVSRAANYPLKSSDICLEKQRRSYEWIFGIS